MITSVKTLGLLFSSSFVKSVRSPSLGVLICDVVSHFMIQYSILIPSPLKKIHKKLELECVHIGLMGMINDSP